MKANNGKSPGGGSNTEEFYKQIQHSLTQVADPSIQWQNGKISQRRQLRNLTFRFHVGNYGMV